MNKYSELSDDEIDLLVVDRLYPQDSKFDLFFREIVIEEIKRGEKSYCNSWSDGGLIIEDNNIGIEPLELRKRWYASHVKINSDGDFHNNTLTADNKNPLRAAMEVFLMMEDARNA